MKPDDFVSVVIPAYRAARTIRRAVDSVLGQTRPPEQVLVVDDGSPDDLAGALTDYGNRVTLIRKPNGGAASARNLGIEKARGRLVAFLDADDYWEPRRLELQLDVMDHHPQVGLVAARYYKQLPGGERWLWSPESDATGFGDVPRDCVLTPADGNEAFVIALRVWTCTVLVRRNVLGAHPFVSGLEPAEDRDLWMRLVTAAPAYLLSEPLATHVFEPGSLSRGNIDRDFRNMRQVIRRNRALLGRAGVRQWEARFMRLWASCHLGEGSPRLAMAPAAGRLIRQPICAEAWWILCKSLLLSGGESLRRLPRSRDAVGIATNEA